MLNHVIECPLMHSIAQASLDIKEIAKYFVMRKPTCRRIFGTFKLASLAGLNKAKKPLRIILLNGHGTTGPSVNLQDD